MATKSKDESTAESRYGQRAIAKEPSGLNTTKNLEYWSERARANSRHYRAAEGEPRKIRTTPGKNVR
jgi:hypothetical protein